jgi:hypothetical protein
VPLGNQALDELYSPFNLVLQAKAKADISFVAWGINRLCKHILCR